MHLATSGIVGNESYASGTTLMPLEHPNITIIIVFLKVEFWKMVRCKVTFMSKIPFFLLGFGSYSHSFCSCRCLGVGLADYLFPETLAHLSWTDWSHIVLWRGQLQYHSWGRTHSITAMWRHLSICIKCRAVSVSDGFATSVNVKVNVRQCHLLWIIEKVLDRSCSKWNYV